MFWQCSCIGDARDQVGNDLCPGRTVHVGKDTAELYVGIFQYLDDAVLLAGQLADDLLLVTDQVAKLPDVPWRYKARLQQPAQQQLGEPGTVLFIGLVPGNIFYVTGIDQQDLEIFFQNIENGFPVDPRALHCHVGDFLALAPIP